MVISRKTLNIVPGTKVHYKKRHLITSAVLTLRKGQGHTTRSNVTDVEVSAFFECFLFFVWFFLNTYFQQISIILPPTFTALILQSQGATLVSSSRKKKPPIFGIQSAHWTPIEKVHQLIHSAMQMSMKTWECLAISLGHRYIVRWMDGWLDR